MTPFILILGPSGAGKSTIIKRLLQNDPNIKYVTPYTDRPPRPGEFFKKSITKSEFTGMEKKDEFLAVNHYFTHRYGTPRQTIRKILDDGNIPILDMILSGVPKFEEYKSILYCIYIKPPSLKILEERLVKDGRDADGQRLREGIEEYTTLESAGFIHPSIDAVVENDALEEAHRKVKNLIDQKVKAI